MQIHDLSFHGIQELEQTQIHALGVHRLQEKG